MSYPSRAAVVAGLLGVGLVAASYRIPLPMLSNQPPSASPTPTATAVVHERKLIELGWDALSPAELRHYQARVEASPFAGTVLNLSVGTHIFNTTASSETEFAQDRADLEAITATTITDNFIRIDTGSDDGWDWYNDSHWAAVEENARQFARTAAASPTIRGIAFDSEPYRNNPWGYADQPGSGQHTFADYERKVRERGQAFMRALQAEKPGLTVFGLQWLSSGDLLEVVGERQFGPDPTLNDNAYGLLPAFLNGMLDVAPDNVTFVDGDEGTYYLVQAEQFGWFREGIRTDARPLIDPANRDRYDRHMQVGAAVYMDLVLDLFNPNDKDWYGVRMPHFLSTADRLRLLENNTYHALRTSDEYVWIYSEEMDWWRSEPKWWGGTVPAGAEDAIRRAFTRFVTGQPLGVDVWPAVQTADAECRAKTDGTRCGWYLP